MLNLTITVKLRLYTNAEQDFLFRKMTQRYRQACNFVSRYIFDHDFVLNSYFLHKELYRRRRSNGCGSPYTSVARKPILSAIANILSSKAVKCYR